jgi:hypothetical protein
MCVSNNNFVAIRPSTARNFLPSAIACGIWVIGTWVCCGVASVWRTRSYDTYLCCCCRICGELTGSYRRIASVRGSGCSSLLDGPGFQRDFWGGSGLGWLDRITRVRVQRVVACRFRRQDGMTGPMDVGQDGPSEVVGAFSLAFVVDKGLWGLG